MSPRSTPLAAEGTAAAVQTVEADITIELPNRAPVAARVYGVKQKGAASPLVLHFHGGTFVCGDLENGRTVGLMLAGAGAVVVSLAYPLAPQHPFPEPIEVGYAALEWMHKNRVKLAGKGAALFLAGEEAGGNLAAAVALISRDRGHPPLAGQILLSPMLDPCAGTASLREATGDATECKFASGWQDFFRCPSDAVHPYAVPGASLRLSEIAPTLVLVGADDPMRDEALAFAKRLREAGNPVTSNVLPSATNWPDALAAPDANECVCTATVQQHFRDFFSAAAPPPAG
ncbi:MAG: alpha/beta hydrolase [Comamonadaceae bacterium]|nr:MAG: alpha/beta hydrolase [Comamonadaceae bacterium]